MKLEILDTKNIDTRNWYLCKGNLLEYLMNLKTDFYDFAIQRKIVRNQYLDKLYTTIKTGDPIPIITLTYLNSELENIIDKSTSINLEDVEILDGLQRSFRLWAYLRIADLYAIKKPINYRDFANEIKKLHPMFFDSGVISTRLLKNMIDDNEIEKIHKSFSEFEILFTIWSGLSEKEVIQKMLVLNAGQKSVSKTHQFELLFLHFYDSIQVSDLQINLYREKDSKANDIKRGKREFGEFMFSSIIVALQSFVEEKPLRISTEKLIENEFEENETTYSVYDMVFNSKYLLFYLQQLIDLDKIISETNESGKEWFSKDTTLSGIFSAIGKKTNISKIENEEELFENSQNSFEILKRRIIDYGFNIEMFTAEYNVLSSRSVNIGNFIRKVVMEYTYSLLNNENPEWRIIFSKVKEK